MHNSNCGTPQFDVAGMQRHLETVQTPLECCCLLVTAVIGVLLSPHTLQVPPTCNPTSWAWARLLQTIKDTIALQLNYCE